MSASEILRERAAEWRRTATDDDPDLWDREDAERGERECLRLIDLLEALTAAEAFDEEEHAQPYLEATRVETRWRMALRAFEAAITGGPQP